MSSDPRARAHGRLRLGALVIAVGWLSTATARADVLWSWSFGTESGTFVTSGRFDQTDVPGVFTFKDFSVTASQFAGNVGATYIQTSVQTMAWDGLEPVQFTRNSGTLTNGSNFDRADGAFFDTLGAPPPTGLVFQNPGEHLVLEAPLTVQPLSDVAINTAPALTPDAAALTVVFLALVAFVRLRRGTPRRI